MAKDQGTIDQYLGRTVDYVALQGVQPDKKVQLEMSLTTPGGGGSIVTGPQKVVQRFLLELLKEKGSMPLRPRGGTDFLTEARQGLLRTAADVRGAFARAVIDIRTELAFEDANATRDDERFRDARLLNVTVAQGTAVLQINVITAAETSRQFIFPLPIMV
jgi:hypothetical protein